MQNFLFVQVATLEKATRGLSAGFICMPMRSMCAGPYIRESYNLIRAGNDVESVSAFLKHSFGELWFGLGETPLSLEEKILGERDSRTCVTRLLTAGLNRVGENLYMGCLSHREPRAPESVQQSLLNALTVPLHEQGREDLSVPVHYKYLLLQDLKALPENRREYLGRLPIGNMIESFSNAVAVPA